MKFPNFDEQLSLLNQFILTLQEEYCAGRLTSWDELELKVKAFFIPDRMDQMEMMVPGWKQMASYSDGVTLTHVMCVFLGLVLLPEYHSLSPEQQQLAKWIVLFHDVEKVHVRGRHDSTHGFRSAAHAGRLLRELGFQTTEDFQHLFSAWSKFTYSAITPDSNSGKNIQDNSKLPEILAGIEKLYGTNTAATLIIKGVLLHMSLDVVKDWPQTAPLSNSEIQQYLDGNLVPLLKVMNLADNEGWTMFHSEIRAMQRNETLAAYQEVEKIIAM